MKSFLNPAVVCFLFFLGVSPLYAQKKEIFRGEWYIGVGGGPLFSKVDFVPAVPEGFKQGIFGGVSARYISEKNLGLVVEVNYARRG